MLKSMAYRVTFEAIAVTAAAQVFAAFVAVELEYHTKWMFLLFSKGCQLTMYFNLSSKRFCALVSYIGFAAQLSLFSGSNFLELVAGWRASLSPFVCFSLSIVCAEKYSAPLVWIKPRLPRKKPRLCNEIKPPL